MATDGEIITSFGNATIKLARSLADRKARREHGVFFAEGLEMLERAKAGGYRIRQLFIAENAAFEARVAPLRAWAEASEARVAHVAPPVMAKLSAMSNPPPVAALLEPKPAALPNVTQVTSEDTWVVLEELRDPGNLGTIIRTADAAGARGVILVGDCADPYAPEAVRASTGSVFAVPVATASVEAFAQWAAEWPGLILGSAATGAADYHGAAGRHPVLLLIGSEANGLSARLTGLCHRLARIPMAGTAESLNAAIATALLLYAVRRPFLEKK
ncbi:MAG: RNA methyltransferase [Hyphomicrobiaceae bacterium]